MDDAGRVSAVNGTAGTATIHYTSATTPIHYAAHGAIDTLTLGNGLIETTSFNNRLQPTQIQAQYQSNSLLTLQFGYGSTQNNGNVLSQTITAPGASAFTQQYGYDGVNRLTSAAEGSVWSRTWEYDRYGNGAVHVPQNDPIQPAAMLTPMALTDFNTATNRIARAGFVYDDDPEWQTHTPKSGNLTLANGVGYQYDAENRMTQAQTNPGTGLLTVQYAYDGDGRRVKKTVGGAVLTTYVYDASGNLAAGYGPLDSEGGTDYLFADHLGSTRVVTDGTKDAANPLYANDFPRLLTDMVTARHDYLPFGEEIAGGIGSRASIASYAAPDNITQKFTGKERDPELIATGTTLDYFGARYFSSNMGRFTSADEPLLDQHCSDPQSWNLYHYGRNNPFRFLDANGQKCVKTNNGYADDGTGGGCPAAGVDAKGNITPQTVNAIDVDVRTSGGVTTIRVDGEPVGGFEAGVQEDPVANLAAFGLFGGPSAATGTAQRVGVWALPPVFRGGIIERMLGANLPRSFQVLDRFINGVATSIKSVDLRAASYQNPTALESKLLGYVEDLAGFQGGRFAGVSITASEIGSRVLTVAVPKGALGAAQQAALSRVAAQAAQQGVQVIIVPIL